MFTAMSNSLAKCGCDCIKCPTYRGNLNTFEDRQKCSLGWEKYLNIKLSAEKLRPCDGCSLSDKERRVFYLNCKIRKCALINNIENCAFCKAFPCDELLNVHTIQKIESRETFIRQTGIHIPENDYRLFIEPYAGLEKLKRIRGSLQAGKIRDFKKHNLKIKFAPFKAPSGAGKAYERIYDLISNLCVEQDVSYARLLTAEKRRERLLKIIWSVGMWGEIDNSGKFLVIDSKTFSDLKLSVMYKSLLEDFQFLKQHSVNCEIIPLMPERWLTPMGGLRKEGWVFRISFDDGRYGDDVLLSFREYINRLKKRYGDKAFRYFKNADMSVA